MAVRNLEELGMNIQKIMKYLMKNQNLLRYLYYTDMEPLATDKADVTIEDVFHKQVLIIPIISAKDDSKSLISLMVMKGDSAKNDEFVDIYFNIKVFVPITQWILKSDSLRPFLIMGEIEKSLKNKTINGLGKITSIPFSIDFLTEEMSVYDLFFNITEYA